MAAINADCTSAVGPGSGLTFIADQDIVDQNTPGVVSGTVITRDGLRFRVGTMDSNGRVVDGYVSGIEDRNGNLINYSWQGTSTGGIYTVTDPLGRATTINYTEALNANTQDIITYPGHDGVSHTITVNYALLSTAATEPLQSYQCLFPELNGSDSTQFNPYVVSSIVLADGTSYSMQYNAYGELARLRLPTGGVYTYSYWEAGCSANGGRSGVITLENNSGYRIWRPLRERDEYSDGVHLSGKLVLSYPGAPADPNHPSRATSEGMADFEDAAGNVLRKEMHFFYGNAASTQAPATDPTAFAPWWEGLEYRTEVADGKLQRAADNAERVPAAAVRRRRVTNPFRMT